MDRYNLVSLAGVGILAAVAWALSANRRVVNRRALLWGVALQLFFAGCVFALPVGARVFMFASRAVVKVIDASTAGAKFCFGALAVPPAEGGTLGFILVFQALPSIVFFAALMEWLYYAGIMTRIVKAFAWVFTRLMNLSGAESLCAAGNIFVGIESSTAILPYLPRMTRSEIGTILTAGLATIASSVLGAYTLMLRDVFPTIAGHLVTASVLSAPAALAMSKLLIPEEGAPETLGRTVNPHVETASNGIEALIRGATNGGKLLLGVILLLLAFVGLISLANVILDGASDLAARVAGVSVSLRIETLLSYVFYPFALIVGVPPADAMSVARLLGIRMVMTEIPAYQELGRMIAAGAFAHPRSAVLAGYALCGFAHIPGVAIFVGGIAAIAPNQTRTLAQVAARALVAATLACLMTAAVAGVFYRSGMTSFIGM